MGFYLHTDKKTGDGLALTEWNTLSSAVAGNSGLTLALPASERVGIGTASPSEKLHVEGKALFSAGSNSQGLFIGEVGHGSQWPGLAHKDLVNPTDYALVTHVSGSHTLINKKNVDGWIGFRVGNVDRMVVHNSGNVGIGTTTPAVKLHVIGDLRVDNGKIQSWGPLVFHPDVDNTGDSIVQFLNSTGGETMRIHANGNVGIGTTTPNALLEIRKDASASLGPVLLLNNNGGGAGSGGAIDFNGYGRNSGVPPTLRLQSLDDGNFSSHFVISTLSGATSAASGSLSERMRIASNGNVGIGTTTPSEKLHVEGKVKATHFIGDGSGLTNLPITGTLSVDKYVVQNGVDGGSTKGIMMWTATDTNWGIYMGTAGANKSLGGGMAPDGFGFNSHALRFRGFDGPGNGFIFENSSNARVFSIHGNSGNVWMKGSLTVNESFNLTQLNDGNRFKMYLGSERISNNDTVIGLVFEIASSTWGSNRKMIWDGDANWDQVSDGMFKTNIIKEEGILNRMMHLNVVNYNWRDKADAKRKPIGFIAQEVKPWFPALVNEYGDPETNEPYLTLNYSGFGVLAVGAIQELKQEHDAKIAALELEIARLKDRMAEA